MSEAVIEISALHKTYRQNKEIVKGLEMTVPRGAVYALLGNNGVGKTTTIKMITGQLAPTSGSVRVFGLDPIAHGVEIKRKMAYVAENQQLYDWMTVNDLIDFTRSFYPGWNDVLCEHLLGMFELPRKSPIKDFSRGMYTKATLLAALCRDPELLILDDPTLGLDTTARREFMRGVVAAIREYERTVVFSTHIIPEIEGLVDHVGIMVDGKLKVEEPVDDLKMSFREIRFARSFADRVPTLPGLVRRQDLEDEIVLNIRAPETEVTEALLTAGIKPFFQTPMNLEEIFLALA